jgi:kynureninase
VIVDVAESAAVYAELEERAILCDYRPGAGIRIGPHFFNTDDEIRLVVEQITDILESGAFERHAGAVAKH